MRRLNNPQYQQRNLLLLLPLILLAIVTWILDKRLTPNLSPTLRADLLEFFRQLFPCLFAITVAFIIPSQKTWVKVFSVSIIYLILLLCIENLIENFAGNAGICALSALSYLLVFQDKQDENSPHKNKLFLAEKIIAIALPFITLISLLIVIRQIRVFVLVAFNDTFSQSLLSIIFAPIFLLLQSLGFQEIVGQVALLRYQNDMISSFINAIYITNIFSLPTIIMARSFFTSGAQRLFLTMLSLIAVLTSSVGTCISLIYIVLIIFWPGTFAILLICSLICYLSSYALEVQAITSINNLYIPDLDLSLAIPFFYSQSTLTLEITGVLMPLSLMFLLMIISKESSNLKRQRHNYAISGIVPTDQGNPDLSVLAILRALGGISNISTVENEVGLLKFKIVDPTLLIYANINALCLRPAEYDRVRKVLYCEIGEQSPIIALKIADFIKNEFGEQTHEIIVPKSFTIRPMPHVHHSGSPSLNQS